MSTMNKQLIIAVLAAILAFGCEEEISLDLPQPPKRLVVEGRVTQLLGQQDQTQHITLSTISDFFDQSQTPRVTDAEVSVRDGEGVSHPYTHDPSTPGRYANTTLVPKVGSEYTLTITWQGETYEATETMIAVPPIISAYQKFEEENQFEDGGLKIAIDFADPSGQTNYYYWELFADGKSLLKADPGNSGNVIAQDRFWDGQTITGYLPNEELTFEPGDEVMVRQVGISKNTYDYLFLLFEQTGQTGQLIDVPPALIRGNIRNLTNPENLAMGYFGASQVAEARVAITE